MALSTMTRVHSSATTSLGVHDFTEEEATWVAVGMRDYLEKDFLHGLRARVKGYVSGRTSVREHNKKFKKEGQGQCE